MATDQDVTTSRKQVGVTERTACHASGKVPKRGHRDRVRPLVALQIEKNFRLLLKFSPSMITWIN